MQRGRFTPGHVGRPLLHQLNESLLQRRRFLETPSRVALDTDVDEGSEGGVVAGDAHGLEIVERIAHPFRREARCRHQLVGGDALVGVGLKERLADDQQLFAVFVGYLPPQQTRLRVLDGADPQGGGKHLHPVLLPGQQHRLFQPGHRRAHPRVVGGRVTFEVVVLVLAQHLAGGGYHLTVRALPAVQLPQRPEHAVNLSPGQPGAGRHPELPFHVVLVVEQHAPGRFLVPSGAARLLQVVLQGAGNVGVDHEAHVGLVDAHAEGVGGDDGPQLTADEVRLDVLPGLRRQSRVEMVRRQSLLLQVLGDLLGVPARGAVDDRAAGGVPRQVRLQYLVDVVELGRAACGHHHELQVLASRIGVQDIQLDPEFPLEVLGDLGLHVGLGGGGQAEDRWWRILAGALPDEASHVPVVGPEVMTPLRKAVGLVQRPGADLPLGQGPAQGDAAQLLG